MLPSLEAEDEFVVYLLRMVETCKNISGALNVSRKYSRKFTSSHTLHWMFAYLLELLVKHEKAYQYILESTKHITENDFYLCPGSKLDRYVLGFRYLGSAENDLFFFSFFVPYPNQ